MKRRNLILFAVALLTLIGLWELRSQLLPVSKPPEPVEKKGPQGPPKTVLLLTDPADEFAGYKTAAQKGALAAIQLINSAGGVRNAPLELVSEEFKESTPEKKPLFAMYTGGNALAANVVAWADKNKLPLLLLNDGPCMTVTPASDGKASPYIWSLGLTWETTLESFFVYLSDQFSPAEGDFTFYYLGGDTPDNRILIAAAREASESLGFKTIHSQLFDTRLADYFPVTRDIIARAPDITFLANRSLSGRLFLQQAAKLALERETHLVGLSSMDTELFEGRLALLDGTFTIGKYDAADQRPANKTYRDALAKTGAGEGILAGAVAEAAYTAVQLGAIARTNATGDDAAAFAIAILKSDFTGPNGRVKMNATNHVLEQPMFVLHNEGGTWKNVMKMGTAIHPNLNGCEAGPRMTNEEYDDRE